LAQALWLKVIVLGPAMSKCPETTQQEIAGADCNDVVVPKARASSALRCVCFLTVFLARLEISVLTLAIPPIASEFGYSLEVAAWVHLAPNFAGIMSAPSVGKASDMYGHGMTWRCAVSLLVASTWLAAWSPSFLVLLIARVGTGISQSGVFAPALALMTKDLDPERRGMVSSQIMTADTLGSGVGMLVGAIAIDHVSWRWIFLGPAPFLSLMCALSFWVVPRDVQSADGASDRPRFDLWGTLLFACGSFSVLLAVNRGNDVGWTSPVVVVLASAGLVLTLVLARVELRASHPVLPVWLFAGRVRSSLLLTCCLATSGWSSTFFLVPVFMQDALGMRPSSIGKLLVVRPFAAAVSSGAMTRLLDNGCLSKLTLARLGACCLCVAYAVLIGVTRIASGTAFSIGIVSQLVLQALGHFPTTLSSNALLVASLPHEELANAVAMQRVVGSSCALFTVTVNLSIIRALGSEFQPECYHIAWLVHFGLGLCIVVAISSTPSSERKYSTLSNRDGVPDEPFQKDAKKASAAPGIVVGKSAHLPVPLDIIVDPADVVGVDSVDGDAQCQCMEHRADVADHKARSSGNRCSNKHVSPLADAQQQ